MNESVKFLNKIPDILKNKYFISFLVFILWVIFLDNYNLISQMKTYNKLEKLKKKKSYYETEIEKDSTELYKLRNMEEEQERFAREKFLMKKKNEDVFIIKKEHFD